MIFSGKGDKLWERPEPGDNIAYMGSCQQLSLVGVWPLGGVSSQMTKGLSSWIEDSRLCHYH